MSSTSAVAVLAQGLRDLRDFAEGPDGQELRQRTGLTAQQIDAALDGARLPTREVTLALVGAWEGDVEAWREYWGQISELVKSEAGEGDGGGGEKGGGRKRAVPVAPEPSIITPLPAQEPETGAGADKLLAEAEGPQAEGQVHKPQEAEGPQAEGGKSQAEAVRASEDGRKDGEGQGGEEQEAEVGPVAGAEEPEEAEEPAPAGAAAAQVLDIPSNTTTTVQLSAATPAAGLPASAPASDPPRKSVVARVGVPAALFVLGVAVGAFGDHAFASKSTSTPTGASVPPASKSSGGAAGTASRSSQPSSAGTASAAGGIAPSSSAAATPSGSGTSSSAGGVDVSPSSGSSTSSAGSTTSSGATLGTYRGIQLASGYSVDFLNDTYHPASGTANGPDSMGFFATSFVDGRFYADRVAVLDSQDTGSYTTCLNDTRYQHDVLLSQVSSGTSFCIHTDTGHLVLVTVRRMPSSTDANPYAVVDLTVWQN
ncbi:hypothetical protein [Catenulispora subtropica]|uniref:hypothetical protein n=1 Tax=Catenulispora subtropica TaxID=450798 RepID=UPI0031CFBF23